MAEPVTGFSKKTKAEKIDWLAKTYLNNNPEALRTLQKYWNEDLKLQKLHDDFIENTVSNYYLPFGVAPNFLINGKLFALPMVIEESSVVAAASNAAKFWLQRGGFKAQVLSTQKNGQVHVDYFGKEQDIVSFFAEVKPKLIAGISTIQKNMKKRGGGLVDIELISKTEALNGYYQLHCTFETLDAMGANFINSCLEQIAKDFEAEADSYAPFMAQNAFPEIVMSILSNYVPECLVKAEVSCPVEKLAQKDISGATFAQKFVRAIHIAKTEPRRAVTHNKGIMNGIDALILATGNDFRAVEAGIHAYASKDGKYTSLTNAKIEEGIFTFSIEIPLALGTVGGLTNLHPLVKFAFDLLQNPNAKQLMEIVAVAGLAQNFAAIRSLVTTGIQKGHMKMHLMNILNQLEASETEKKKAVAHFNDNTVSHSAVISFLDKTRA
ncbi:hydroxymethylglutaryl-CoA reductase, degradative [Marixanthomonas spongiae]|uniref:3-hydroxy-3-methylglutaryl coenzyme A reductase n=1 Tax=Marixanthomonas spongiae TaxID=2174845 RepID=A0A2U0I8B8_9FLAO|nr:hydroxymethylglutaryl-CoA reductase, degradative [Marixanthomonas spongiae]PVW17314.1 hydroxymethylglutaryl-CoA reductase, degradative [Marixanthomonas spongiae]